MSDHSDDTPDQPRPDGSASAAPEPPEASGDVPAEPAAAGGEAPEDQAREPQAPEGDAPADQAADGEDGPDWEQLAAADPRSPGQLLAALDAAAVERDEYLDGLRRKQAEFENFRKRMMRDGASQRIAGHAEVAERLLDVLDDFDRTLEAAGDSSDPGFVKGVQLVHDKLVAVLDDFGLTRIDDVGVDFDPNRHEAVQQEPADEPRDEPVVSRVLRPGYELGGRVLRAAMVVVAQ